MDKDVREIIIQAHLKGQIDAGAKEPSTYQAVCYYAEWLQDNDYNESSLHEFKGSLKDFFEGCKIICKDYESKRNKI